MVPIRSAPRLSGTQTLTLLGAPALTPSTINAFYSWDGGSPIDIAWTPESGETFVVARSDETGTWDATCRVVNDGLWTLPAMDQYAWYWSVWISRGHAVAVDSPELGHVLLYTSSSGSFDYMEEDDYDDM